MSSLATQAHQLTMRLDEELEAIEEWGDVVVRHRKLRRGESLFAKVRRVLYKAEQRFWRRRARR